jgi:hypothetical protein
MASTPNQTHGPIYVPAPHEGSPTPAPGGRR